MAEMRTFRGLRYDTAVAGDLSNLVAPPYDVISPAQQRALHEASPYNVVHLEYGLGEGDERYTTAGRLLREWMLHDILRREPDSALYLYEQGFTYAGRPYRRRSLIGRVRLYPFDAGVVRPHEYTMSGPKEDRLKLLAATNTNISPVFSLYMSDANDPIEAYDVDEGSGPVARAVDFLGVEHLLLPITDVATQQEMMRYISPRTLYIADGHHRYETALRYRDDRRRRTRGWSASEPENFIMMAVAAHSDPGLLILPIHRLVRPKHVPRDLSHRLQRFFDVRQFADDPAGADAALAALTQQRAEETLIVAAGVEPGKLLLLRLRDKDGVSASMPAERSAAWKSLDVNVLQYGVLDAGLGIDIAAITAGGQVEFNEDAAEALNAVREGYVPLAFLLNPTTPLDIFTVAETGDRMPQKSTYFYPKLGTGLVLNPLS